MPGNVTGNDVDGTWSVHAYEDDDGIEHFELESVDDMLRFSPWMDREQAVLLELSERYGMRLKGNLSCLGSRDISLSVFLEQKNDGLNFERHLKYQLVQRLIPTAQQATLGRPRREAESTYGTGLGTDM